MEVIDRQSHKFRAAAVRIADTLVVYQPVEESVIFVAQIEQDLFQFPKARVVRLFEGQRRVNDFQGGSRRGPSGLFTILIAPTDDSQVPCAAKPERRSASGSEDRIVEH